MIATIIELYIFFNYFCCLLNHAYWIRVVSIVVARMWSLMIPIRMAHMWYRIDDSDIKNERREILHHVFTTFTIFNRASSFVKKIRYSCCTSYIATHEICSAFCPACHLILTLRLRFTMPFAIHCKRLVTHYARNKIPSSQQRNVTLTILNTQTIGCTWLLTNILILL